MKQSARPHLPVMANEFVNFFEGKQIDTFFEGTLGAGGHAQLLLQNHPEIKRYIACDRDPDAIAIAKETLKPWKDKVDFIHGDFAHLDRYLKQRGVAGVDGFFLIWGFRRCN